MAWYIWWRERFHKFAPRLWRPETADGELRTGTQMDKEQGEQQTEPSKVYKFQLE